MTATIQKEKEKNILLSDSCNGLVSRQWLKIYCSIVQFFPILKAQKISICDDIKRKEKNKTKFKK